MSNVAVFRISHTVPLDPQTAFSHWTSPEHFSTWWGPDSVDLVRCDMDVRPGGKVHYGMRDKTTGQESWGKWDVLEVDAPTRLVVLNMFADREGNPVRHPMAPEWPLKTLATTTFTPEGDGTRMDIEWSPFEASEAELAIFASSFESMTMGWSGSFATWDAYIASLSE